MPGHRQHYFIKSLIQKERAILWSLQQGPKKIFFFLSVFVRLSGFYSFFSFFIFLLILFFFPCVPQGIYLSSIISFVLRAAVCEHALRQWCSDKSGERFAWRCFDMFKGSYSITRGVEGQGQERRVGRQSKKFLLTLYCSEEICCERIWPSTFLPGTVEQGFFFIYFFCAREYNYWFSKKKCSSQRIQTALISSKMHTAGLGLFKRHCDESVSCASPIFSFILISFSLNVLSL